jgi:hypothetical protein
MFLRRLGYLHVHLFEFNRTCNIVIYLPTHFFSQRSVYGRRVSATIRPSSVATALNGTNITHHFSLFPVPVCAITSSRVPGDTFVSVNRFSTLCGWLAQRQEWRVKGWIWPSEQPRSAKVNSWLDYQMGDRKWEFCLFVPVGLQEFFYMP